MGLPTHSLEHSPEVYDYIMSNDFVAGIKGAVGAGKTFGSGIKVMRHASEMPPDNHGYRRSRCVAIRNTYPELKSTTIQTWEDVFEDVQVPPIIYSDTPIRQNIKIRPRDFKWINKKEGRYQGVPGLDFEIWFLALDKVSDVKRLKSLECTFAFINEACEVPVAVIDMLTARVGRYPKRDSIPAGDYWCGIFYDTNAADETAWTEEFETNGAPKIVVELPNGEIFEAEWSFFTQPPALLEVDASNIIIEAGHRLMGEEVKPTTVMSAANRLWAMNPDAENMPNLKPGYYAQQLTNKALSWIHRYIQVKRVYISEGEPWVPEFSQTEMVRPLKATSDLQLFCGIDIGGGTLQPAAVWGQVGQLGDWRTLSELVIAKIGLKEFLEAFFRHQALTFPGIPLHTAFLDPAAGQRDPIYMIEIKQHMINSGIPAQLAPTNNIKLRRDAMAGPMTRNVHLPDGTMVPGFLIDPSCKQLIAGLGGKWCKQVFQRLGGVGVDDKPVKNQYSHPGDALGYMLSGAGESAVLTRGRKPGQTMGRLSQMAKQPGGIKINIEHDLG